jgi:hypothetical protein
MKFEDLKFETRKDGVYCRAKFDNGYGASVVSHAMSYGGTKGLYEIAVLEGDSITYDTPVTNDVLGWLKPADVERVLGEIQSLPPCKG